MRQTLRHATPGTRIIAKICLCLALSGIALAQERGSAEPNGATPASGERADQSKDRGHFGRELARESREAAGEDENAQFKRSPSVQWVARITGLSLQNAYWLCLLLNFGVVAGLITDSLRLLRR